jgi:hypothetical protein
MTPFSGMADGDLFRCAILRFPFEILRTDARRLVLTHVFHLLSKFLTDPSPENEEGEGIIPSSILQSLLYPFPAPLLVLYNPGPQYLFLRILFPDGLDKHDRYF